MVELVANATHRRDNQNQDYTDCISNLFQLAVDISIYGKQQQQQQQQQFWNESLCDQIV